MTNPDSSRSNPDNPDSPESSARRTPAEPDWSAWEAEVSRERWAHWARDLNAPDARHLLEHAGAFFGAMLAGLFFVALGIAAFWGAARIFGW